MSAPIVVLSAVRTPWGSLLGSLSDVSAVNLGAAAAGEALRRSGLEDAEIDRVVMGNLHAYGCEGNPAGAAFRPKEGPAGASALTVRCGCASGLAAAIVAIEALGSGAVRAVLAGGFESASQAPHLATGLRRGLRLGGGTLRDAARLDGPSGEISPRPAREARTEGDQEEIVPVAAPPPGGGPRVRIASDDGTFAPGGTSDAPAPPLADGAAAFVLATEEWALGRGRTPLCRITAMADPLTRAPEACLMALDLPSSAAPPTGGGAQPAPDPIPGHAPGADGARLIVSLAHAVKAREIPGIAAAGDNGGTVLAVRLEPWSAGRRTTA